MLYVNVVVLPFSSTNYHCRPNSCA